MAALIDRSRGKARVRDAVLLWLPFLLVWLWSARYNPWTHVPFYGDTLEVIWGANWYAEHLRQVSNPLFYERVFYPTGWPTALLAHSPLFLLGMGFFRLFLPQAATFNLFVFLSFAAAYIGVIKAARLYTQTTWITIVVALLYTFWGMRWVRLGGHLNILWMSAALPWMVWTLYQADRGRRVIGTALVWSLCIIASLYGIWIGALIVGLFFLNYPRRERLVDVLSVAALTGLLSLPTLLPFWQARRLVDAPFFSLEAIAGWGASLNSLPIPAVYHPWLGGLARSIYSGPLDESGVANLGLIAVLLVIILLVLRGRLGDEAERFAFLLFAAGLIIALGPMLRWNGRFVEVEALTPLNRLLWSAGQVIKPAVFPGDLPQALEQGIPLPAWPLYAGLPFLEGNRVPARFAFIGGLGLVLLLAILLPRLRSGWLLALLAALLLFERAPWPADQAVPLPGSPHDAFAQVADASALIDLLPAGDQLTLAISGETLYATELHKLPTASGVSTMWPASAWFLFDWLVAHPRPLQHEDLAVILQGYGVDHILLHMSNEEGWKHLDDGLAANLQQQACFDPPSQPSAWPHPICIVQVAADTAFTADPRQGWSAPEPWGRWATDTTSTARWAVPEVRDYELYLNAFPHWVEGRTQEVTLFVNENQIGSIEFGSDAAVERRFAIPAAALRAGWNELTFHSSYAVAPAEASNGSNPDSRPLSFGVNQLVIEPRGS